MKKNIQTLAITFLLTVFFILVLTTSKEVLETVDFSILIWKDNLFPSLFPFLIMSYLLTNYGVSELFSEFTKPFITNFLHLPKSCGFTLIASMMSGFPSNAKFIREQLDKGEISVSDANYLLSFCHFSSPLFVVGTIGTMLLGSAKVGFLILIAHYLGNFMIAIIFRSSKKQTYEKINFRRCFQRMCNKTRTSESFAVVLKEAIRNALDTLFLLLGIVTIFLIITNLVTKIFPFSAEQKMIFSGLLEMTQGVKAASLFHTSILNKALLMLAVISFGGFSVHTQIFSIMEDYKVSYWKFLRARVFHVLFSIGIFFLLFGTFL